VSRDHYDDEEDELLSQCASVNFYDAIRIDDTRFSRYSERLFGNSNIGDLRRTNLQVPGTLTFNEELVLLRRWYARTNLPSTAPFTEAFERWSQSVVIQVMIGDRYRWLANLSDLYLARRQPYEHLWPLTASSRVNVSVMVDVFDSEANDRLLTMAESAPGSFVWVHLEGLRVPHKLAGRVLQAITKVEEEARSAEGGIVSWIMAQGKKLTDDGHADEGGQLMVVGDAILEGRWRGEGRST
jgi:hypothetical protein